MKHLGLLLLAILALLATAAPAGAVDLEDFDVTFTNAKGEEAMTAGEHPYAMSTSFKVAKTEVGGKVFPVEAVKDLRVGAIPGLAGIPVAVRRCASADFRIPVLNTGGTECANSSVVGVLTAEVGEAGESSTLAAAVYNLQPSPGHAAKFGFRLPGVSVTVDLDVSETYPHEVVASLHNTSQVLEFFASTLTLWGNPAAKVHDPFRGTCLAQILGSGGELDSLGKCSADVPEVPFLVNPRACEGPLETFWQTISWDNPLAPPATGSVATHDASGNPRGFGGCGELPFAPALTLQPTLHSAESASGLEAVVDVPNAGLTAADSRAASDIKKAVVTLPEGMTINPSQAEGLVACSEADLARETATSAPGAGCPQESKVGTVEVKSPLLPEETFKGDLFVATPYQNPFNSLIAVYMTVKDPQRGVGITLAGKVAADPRTGQIVTTFGDPSSSNPAFRALPQLPVSSFRLHFREGGRSPLITPSHCGSFTTTAEFTPWANPSSSFTSSPDFKITQGVGGGPCPAAGAQPFVPGFSAGTVNNNAGSYSPFLMRLTRRDGDQDLTRFDATLPRGVVAKLAGVSQCPDAAIAAMRAKTGRQELASPSCPANSRIGSVIAGAGVGSQLIYVPGSIYLAGPFAGAPLSVVGVVPAVAGPFDVGTVVTRQALTLDPVTAEVKVDGAHSDPIPHILAGIPLRVRDIRVAVDRPSFTLNPTSCAEMAIGAALWGGGSDPFSSADDAPVSLAQRFQAASCASLAFKPKLALRLKGGVKRGAHPAFRATLTYPPGAGYANVADAVVTLPHSAFLEQAHIRTICTRVQFAAKACPKGSIYGKARAFTPLLDEPLEGPLYLRSSSHNLPDLVVALHGIVDIDLVGRIDSHNAGIRSSFENVPDAPVSKFVLEMQGGKKGLIVNSRNLCTHKSRASAVFAGQNGRRHEFRPVVKASCGGKAPRKARTP